jgi:hypothetical protein
MYSFEERGRGIAKPEPKIPLVQVLPKPNLNPVEGEELLNIFELETSLKRLDQESIQEWFDRTKTARALLDRFYNQTCFKRRKRELKVDIMREKNHLLSMIIMMSSRFRDIKDKSGTILVKRDRNRPVIVVFGKARFKNDERFIALEKFLIPRLVSLGVGVGYVDEHLTSQKCPCCAGEVEEPCGNRIKYCRECNVWFHRDTMAAQNQLIRKRSELFDGTVPKQFQRPPPRPTATNDDAINIDDATNLDDTTDVAGIPRSKKKRKGKRKRDSSTLIDDDLSDSDDVDFVINIPSSSRDGK